MPRTKLPPKYRLHKASGQAVVTLNGRDIYLGPYGSAQSRELYAKLLASPAEESRPLVHPHSRSPSGGVLVIELLAAFAEYAQAYYVDRDGNATGELNNYRTLVKRLKIFGRELLVSEFGPKRLREFRDVLIEDGLARTTVNIRD